MKKFALALAAASVCAAPAFAQTQVTLYGVVDLGLTYTSDKGGDSLKQLRPGNTLTSRLGFRGTEDLGGGLRAMFNLETGLNPDTGTSSSGTTFWNRQAWVGLSMDGVGQLTAGLQLPTISDAFVGSAGATWFGNQAAALDGAATAAGSSAARFSNMIGGTRVVNAIKFNSASFAGFKLGAMTALGEGATTNGRMDSVALMYADGPYEAAVAWHRTNCAQGSSCPANGGKDEITGIGGAYKFDGGGRIGAFFTREKNAKNVRDRDADVLSVLVAKPYGAWTLMAGYQGLNDRTAAGQDVQQLNLGVKYALSKRTELYGLYSAQRVDNDGKAGMYAEPSSDDRQHQFALGVRHSF